MKTILKLLLIFLASQFIYSNVSAQKKTHLEFSENVLDQIGMSFFSPDSSAIYAIKYNDGSWAIISHDTLETIKSIWGDDSARIVNELGLHKRINALAKVTLTLFEINKLTKATPKDEVDKLIKEFKAEMEEYRILTEIYP